jgi:Carboxypeptidase regulatory-like domain
MYCLKTRYMMICRILFVITVGFLSVSQGFAQGVGGKISGRVTDPSGAFVPGVHVSAQDARTNVVSATETDTSGYYLLQLPSGDYVVSVSATGFATLVQQNVSVTIGGDVGLDFQLQVASTTTTVEVKGDASAELITPNSSVVQTTVDNSLVTAIPVEVSGAMRNASSFLKLEPGYNGSSLNGGAPQTQPMTVDGADVAPVGFGTGVGSPPFAAAIPSFAVQEFQVVGDSADANIGRTSTGAITYALKSGTNQLHGNVFDYNRNTIYDAKNYFAPTRGVDRQNEFGFGLGGPIKRDKTFFYGYYDGFRYSTTTTGVAYSLLTPAMRAGDFTAAGIPAIYDPATTVSNGAGGFTRQQFSCNGVLNMICPNRISSVSAYYASLYPNPTLPGITNNYLGSTISDNNSDQFLIKIDHSFSPSSRLSASYNWNNNPQLSSCGFGVALCGGTPASNHGDRAIVNWNLTISANKVNHVILSLTFEDYFQHKGGQNSFTSGDNLNAMAGLGFVNQTGGAAISAGGYYLGGGSSINKDSHTDGRFGDDFTWIHGSHESQFGVSILRFYTIGSQGGYHPPPFGTFTFSPLESGLPGNTKTGYAAASFLLGQVDSAGFAQNPEQAMVMPYYALYAQDKWKIRSNVTLTYGMRWEYNSPITHRNNFISNFDPTLPNTAAGNLPGALVFAGFGTGKAGRRQFANAWYGGFGPRVGLSYALKPGTVIRAAYGLMYDTNSQPAIVLNSQGYYANTTVTSPSGGVTPAFNWNSGFPAIPLGPDLDPTVANGGSTSWMPPYGARLPAVENYNVGIQQKLWGGVVLDASYVGTQSHHMGISPFVSSPGLNLNQLNPKYLALGTVLQSSVGSAQANAAGITAPYPGFVGTVAQALLPYPQYQAIIFTDDPVGNQHYNALQMKAQKTFGGGLSMILAYTYEKNITNVNGFGAQNYYNLKAEKAVASFDIPQSLVGGYTYDLPIGKGKLLGFNNSLANKLLDGWTTSGTVTLQSGKPINVTTELSLAGIGAILPNVVAGQPLYGPADGRGSFVPSVDKYINIGAFASPAPFTFGNAPRYFDSLRAFGLRDWDVALQKRFPVTERIGITLKGEFFNVLNVVNFGAPNADIQSAAFGKITSINGNPRNGQVSGTVSW